jgi:hypothetical protein
MPLAAGEYTAAAYEATGARHGIQSMARGGSAFGNAAWESIRHSMRDGG